MGKNSFPKGFVAKGNKKEVPKGVSLLASLLREGTNLLSYGHNIHFKTRHKFKMTTRTLSGEANIKY